MGDTPDASLAAACPVRICKIAGRWLVFDAEAVALLRRKHNINGILVGTTPQQPTQNIFLGLPVELRPEEVQALVQRDVAYVVDDVAAHRATLLSPDRKARRTYAESLRCRKKAAQRAFADQKAKKAAEMADRRGPAKMLLGDPDQSSGTEMGTTSTHRVGAHPSICGLTPTSSSTDLIPCDVDAEFGEPRNIHGPLCCFLQRGGYYMTPGLRFGAQYSVYPGDPLRFHAHFMANQYDWDAEIPMLDVVSSGRLATAVKKAFLFGGQPPCSEASPNAPVRTFSVEWAAM